MIGSLHAFRFGPPRLLIVYTGKWRGGAFMREVQRPMLETDQLPRSKEKILQDRQCTYKVTLWCIRAAIVAVEINEYYTT
jgi:hypothetical protein